MGKYLKMDFYRLFTSKSLIVAASGVALVYLVGWIEVSYSDDVFSILYYIKMYSIMILVFAFSASTYANALVEDAEHKYWYLMMERGNLTDYIWSKVIVCFCAAVIAMAAGTMLFVVIARFKLPFLKEDNFLIPILMDGCIGALISRQTILLYFLLSAVWMGLLGGILALFSMWLSLYVRNRMFAICLPVVGFYFWTNYFQRIIGDFVYLDLNSIYIGVAKSFQNPVFCFAYALFLASLFGILLGRLIQGKVQREIRGEAK